MALGIHVRNDAAGDIARRKGFTGTVEVLPLGVDIERFHPGTPPSTEPPTSSTTRHRSALR